MIYFNGIIIRKKRKEKINLLWIKNVLNYLTMIIGHDLGIRQHVGVKVVGLLSALWSAELFFGLMKVT